MGHHEFGLRAFRLSRYWAQVYRAELVVADHCPLLGLAHIKRRHAGDWLGKQSGVVPSQPTYYCCKDARRDSQHVFAIEGGVQITQFPLKNAHHLVHGVRGQVVKKVVAEVTQVTANQQVPETGARGSRG
jgi:hypothetical protein